MYKFGDDTMSIDDAILISKFRLSQNDVAPDIYLAIKTMQNELENKIAAENTVRENIISELEKNSIKMSFRKKDKWCFVWLRAISLKRAINIVKKYL